MQLGQRQRNTFAALAALLNLAYTLDDQGRRLEAVALCESGLREFVDARGRRLPLAETIYLPLGRLAYAADQLAEAEELTRRGLAAARQSLSNQLTLGGDGEMMLALIEYARGETEAALETLRQTRRAADALNFTTVARLMTLQEITLLLRGRQVAAAAALFQTLPDPGVGAASAEQNTVIEARLALAQGQPQRALTLLNDIAQATEAGGRLRRALTVRLLQALAHAALGHEPAALAALSAAVQQAAPQNCRRPFLDEDPALARLLPRVRPVAPEFVDALLAGFGAQRSTGAETAGAPSPFVEPLSDRERQIVRLLDEGLSNQAIAERLVITLGTTKWHLNQIYGKLGVNSRTQAVRRAHELKLL